MIFSSALAAVNIADNQATNANIQQPFSGANSKTYPQIFNESGLPSGTEWSVIINGTTYSTTSNNVSVSLVNGSYSVQFSSPNGYFPTPSKCLFTVHGPSASFPPDSSRSFHVDYASSHNESYIKPAGTLYPLNNQKFSGIVLNDSYFNLALYFSLGMAYDSSSGLLFVPEHFLLSRNDSIYVYNTLTNHFIGAISGLGSYQTIYNQNTKFIYSMSFSGNITEINPSTMSVVKNLTLPVSSFGIGTYLQSQGSYIYALNTNGIISVINPSTLSPVKTIKVGNSHDISPIFTVYGGNAFLANSSGDNIVIVNLTTSSEKYISLPKDYTPESVIDYYGSELFIGGSNYSDKIYNASSGNLSTGPMISGRVSSIAYSSFNNIDYVASPAHVGGLFGNITAINPSNGKIIARIPDISSFGLVFSPANGNIYADSVVSGIILVYTTPQNHKATPISSNEIYAIIGIVAAIAVIAGAALVMRKKK